MVIGDLFVNIKDKLYGVLEEVIQKRGVKTFYTGGIGESDSCFYSVVKLLKYKYPYIKIILVKYYFTNELNKNRDYYIQAYDSIIIPYELIEKHHKDVIKLRNRWMIDNSDIIVSCVFRDFGGAYEAVKYAINCKKEIIEVIQKPISHC